MEGCQIKSNVFWVFFELWLTHNTKNEFVFCSIVLCIVHMILPLRYSLMYIINIDTKKQTDKLKQINEIYQTHDKTTIYIHVVTKNKHIRLQFHYNFGFIMKYNINKNKNPLVFIVLLIRNRLYFYTCLQLFFQQIP